MLENAGRRDVSPAPADLARSRSNEAARENAARAEPQAVRARRRDLKTAADEGDDEAVGKRGAKLLDEVEDQAALVTLRAVHDAEVGIEAGLDECAPDLAVQHAVSA